MGLQRHTLTQAGLIQEWTGTEPVAQRMNPPATGKGNQVWSNRNVCVLGGKREKARGLR